VKRLEAICDAVAACNNYFDPDSEAYELRNPLLLIGTEGKRRFSCHKAGYASGMDRVSKYCLAHPEDSLNSLLEYCGVKLKLQQERAIDFISRCVNSNGLSMETRLDWFLEHGHATTANSR
jgi:hypothetical protein